MYRLAPHASTPPVTVTGVSLMWMEFGGGRHQLTYRISDAARLVVPGRTSREREDGLWRATCFELFLSSRIGPDYHEFNFSPSQRWAAWRFAEYREGRTDWPMDRPPLIDSGFEGEDFVLRVQLSGFPEGMAVAGVSAVVVERSLPEPGDDSDDPAWIGVGSLWALNHPRPLPDFHHRGSFTMPLAPGFR